MSTTEQICKTVLLDDVPAQEDAFGPHQRVADAIVNLIETEPGGRVIGLEGGWGAGKSTVIGFVREALQKNENSEVVMFDAWAHEGDPLRRTFLETIILSFARRKWGGDFKDDLDEIANRRKVITTKTASRPTILGNILALALLLVGPCSVLLSSAIQKNWPTYVRAVLAIGAFSPIVVLAIYEGIALIAWLRGRPLSAANNWSLLLKSSTTDTRTESTESPNPTSIEFEKRFRDVMERAVSVKKKRKVVIVLDNLDRVATEDAISIWSTLQTFLKERDRGRESWFNQVWVLVPYDAGAIKKIWDKESSDDGASQSFLDKSFQLRFQVSPPVLSDWKAYLYSLIRKALPAHSDEEACHDLYRVYSTQAKIPTPREIKLYVNQIGAIHRQWQHEFPLQHVAAFVLHCKATEAFIEKLRRSEMPPEDLIRAVANGDELKQNLAGLAFNVPAQKGMELLLSQPLFNALKDADQDALSSLIKANEKGALAVLESVLATQVYDSSPTVVANAARAIFSSEVLNGENLDRVAILQQLRLAILHVDNWSPFDEGVASGLKTALQFFKSEGLAKRILDGIAQAIDTGPTVTLAVTPQRAKHLLEVLEVIVELGLQDAIERPIQIPGPLQDWPKTCELLAERGNVSTAARYLQPAVPAAGIIKMISDAAAQGSFNGTSVSVIRATHICCACASADWNQVANSIHQRLSVGINQNLSNAEVGSLLQGLWTLQGFGVENASNFINALVSSGHAAHYFQRSLNDSQWQAASLCVLSILRANPRMSAPPNIGQAAAGHQSFLSELARSNMGHAQILSDLIEEYRQEKLLLEVTAARGTCDPLIAACLRILSVGEQYLVVFDLDTVGPLWPQVKAALDEGDNASGFGDLVRRLITDGDLCTKVRSAATGFHRGDIVLYESMVEQAGEGHEDFLLWCKAGLEALSKSDWADDLEESCDYARLASLLSDTGSRPHLSTPFSDALLECAESIAKGEFEDAATLRDVLAKTLPCLDASVARTLAGSLFKIAINMDGAASREFFQLFGTQLDSRSEFVAQPRIVERFASPILRRRNVAGLTWLIKFLGANADVLGAQSPSDNVEEFRTRIRDCIEKPEDDEAQPLIDQLAKIAKVRPDILEESPDSDAEAEGEDSTAERN